MSDTVQAGFWQASDGKWYPPQTHPTATMPVGTQAPPAHGAPEGGQGSPAPGKRNGWLKYGLIGVAGLILIGIIAAIAGGGGTTGSTAKGTATTSASGDAGGANTATGLYPNRPDSQKEDKEAVVGGSVELSGYTTTVKAASFQPSLSIFEDKGYIVAEVQILNRDDKAQAYNLFDWKLQSPGGTVKDVTFATIDGLLESGDLVSKGTVTGKVVFEVGAEKGDFFIIYKPDAFNAARGIWKVTA